MTEQLHDNHELIEEKNREYLDRSPIGIALQEAYTASLNKNPEIADVEIVPVPEDSNSFATAVASWKSETERPQVRFRVEDFDATMQKYAKQATQPHIKRIFAEKFALLEEEVTPQLLYVASFAHELGHTVEHKEHEHDHESYDRDVKRSKEAMPLGNIAVSKLMQKGSPMRQYVLDNWDQAVARTGVNTLEDMAVVQGTAYRELPTEHAADMFAADVLWSMPREIREALCDPNGLSDLMSWQESQMQYQAA